MNQNTKPIVIITAVLLVIAVLYKLMPTEMSLYLIVVPSIFIATAVIGFAIALLVIILIETFKLIRKDRDGK